MLTDAELHRVSLSLSGRTWLYGYIRPMMELTLERPVSDEEVRDALARNLAQNPGRVGERFCDLTRNDADPPHWRR